MNLTATDNLNSPLVIDKSSKFDYDFILSFLSKNGYVRVSGVKESGEFAVKVDIIDIFPKKYKNPIRFNIFD